MDKWGMVWEIRDEMLLAVEEFEKNLFGKSGHFDYLNGKIAVIKVLLENLRHINCEYDARIILDFCQETLRKVGEEQYGGVKATIDFTGDGLKGSLKCNL